MLYVYGTICRAKKKGGEKTRGKEREEEGWGRLKFVTDGMLRWMCEITS